jgi:hypothetical protein
VSNSGRKKPACGNKGQRDSSAKYAQRNRRDKNKAARIAKDKARAKPMPCGHGSRYRSNIDDTCKRCHGVKS